MSRGYIVVCGNVADGFSFYGPFIDAEAANEWADTELDNADCWHVVELTPVDEP